MQISIRAEDIFHIGNFAVTNSVLSAFVTLLVLAGAALFLRRRLKMIPGKLQNILEIMIEGALGLMDSVLGDRRKSEKYFPVVFTIFLFVLFSNWLGLIPGVGSLVINTPSGATPAFRSPSADLNFTLALALIAVTFVNVFGIIAVGWKERLGTFLNFKDPISFFTGILELISEFAKIISFSFRLFGNIFAGEVLLTIMAALVPFLVPVPFFFLEIFVGFIQAFIFGMLTLVFIAMATSGGHLETSGAGESLPG